MLIEKIIAAITGSAVSIITAEIRTRIIDPTINRNIIQRDLNKAVSAAVNNIWENFEDCFIRELGGALDHSFWKNAKVINELWKVLTDRVNCRRIPNFDILYQAYCEVFEDERVWIDRLRFDQVVETFWTYFIREAKESEILSKLYRRKLDFLHDETVYPYEGRQMITEYCRRILPHLKDELFRIFSPGSLEDVFSREEIENEFLDYHRTRMTYTSDGQDFTEREERELEVNSFLEHDRMIFVGDSGVGKTRFLRELEKELTEKNADDMGKAEYLPIYFEADSFNDHTEDYLVSIIKDKIKRAFQPKEGRVYDDGKIEGFIRYLFMYKRLFPLVDAFDQVTEIRANNIFNILAKHNLFGEGRCYVTTRPYSLDYLVSGIKNKAGKQSKVVHLYPFDDEEVKCFFKDHYPKVEPLIEKLKHDAKDQVHIVRIPMLARLMKIMIIEEGWWPPFNGIFKESPNMTRTELMEMFVNFNMKEQIPKDPGMEDIRKKERLYKKMLRKLRVLSLKTLEKGWIYKFNRDFAEKILGDTFDKAELIQLIRPFIDQENEISWRNEEEHRYQHQIFQEFFAAQRLYELYKEGKTDEMVGALKNLILKHKDANKVYSYMPDVGRFFAEMVELNCKNSEEDFYFWQELLMDEDTDAWVRTYALQVRDKLGERKAKQNFFELLKDENRELDQTELDSPYIHIPARFFIYGFYEYGDKQPVKRVYLEGFEIGRYPVTNREYKKFVEAGGYKKKAFWTKEGWKWRTKKKIFLGQII